MVHICLLSDTHSYIDDQILGYCKGADEIWHAGDIGQLLVTDRLAEIAPVRAVYGNIDGPSVRQQWPLHQKFKIEDLQVWITHIGGYPGRYDKSIREDIKDERPGLFISGHSHILKVMNDKRLGLLHMNPGAIGKHGFHKVRTMLRFDIDHSRVTNLEVVEIDR